jgi:ATP/ADP translocase
VNLQRAAWKLFSIQKNEIKFTVPLFLLYLLSGSFYAFGQIYTETIFLKAYGAQGLSRFFVYNGIAIIFTGILYNYLLLKISLRKGYYFLVILFSSLIAASSLLVGQMYSWLPLYLFLGNYIFTFFLDIHFFNFSFQYLSLRSSKRVLPFLMGGGKLGGIIASLLIFTVFSEAIIKYGMMLWLINGLIIVIPLIILSLLPDTWDRKADIKANSLFPDSRFVERVANRIKTTYSIPIFLYSVLAIFLMAIVNLIAEYYFAKIFNAVFTTKEELARFLGMYTFCADFLTLIVQMFIVSRIIRTIGVKASNMIYPVSYLAFAVFMVWNPVLLAGVFLRFFRKNLSVIFRHPVFNVIMAAAPRDRLADVKSFISAIILPLGMITGGGVILLLYKKLSQEAGYCVVLGTGALYVLVTVLQNRAYVRSLRQQLSLDYRQVGDTPISVEDYTALYKEKRQIENSLPVYEAFFMQKPAPHLLFALYPHFNSLHYETKERMLLYTKNSSFNYSGDIIAYALRDNEPTIRAMALWMIKDMPREQRVSLLANRPGKLFRSEEYAREFLLEGEKKTAVYGEADIESSSFAVNLLTASEDKKSRAVVLSRLYELANDVLFDDQDPVEFLMYAGVLDPELYRDLLVNVAVRTGDVRCLKALIPISGPLTTRQVRRLIYVFSGCRLSYLKSVAVLSDAVTELDKAMVLNLRRYIKAEEMGEFFISDEKVIGILKKRIFRHYCYYRKANYLNYFISLNIRPKKILVEFIAGEISRILEIRAAWRYINSGEHTKDQSSVYYSFIDMVLRNEVELHKHLILKAIGIVSGIALDDVYESNLFLKDKDVSSYIMEYIESSGRYHKKTLFIFEGDVFNFEKNDNGASISENGVRASLEQSSGFMPELSDLIAYSVSMFFPGSEKNAVKRKKTGITSMENAMESLLKKLITLKENHLFRDIDLGDLIHLAKVTKEVEVPAHRLFIRELENGDELFIIVDGEVEVFTGKRIIERLSGGSCIGELSIIDKEPRSASVRTSKKTRLLSLNRKDFLLTLKDNPTIAINVMQVIAQRLRKMLV